MEDTNGFTSVNSMATTYPSDPIPAPTGTKRKRDSKPSLKFYAVRVGKEPGIYHSWNECLDQVRGFPKAAFKSFTVLADAEAFLNNEESSSTSTKGGAPKFYGVREGRTPGVYTSWPDVLQQITGWKGPKHKVFKTRAEAEQFVNEGREWNQSGIPMLMNGEARESVGADGMLEKKAKTGKKGGRNDESPTLESAGEYAPGEGPLPEDAEDGFDASVVLDQQLGTARYKTALELGKTKYQASAPVPEAPIRIYTDGSALSNGMQTSNGGVGVYFGPKDKRNVSEPLTGTKQTNQRAELTAILRALEVAPRDRRIVIISDSQYAIKCATEWFEKWRRNNWHNAANKPVENKDLIQKVVDMLEERIRLNKHRIWEDDDDDLEGDAKRGPWDHGPASVKFVWVKGHAKDEGNNAADELAVNGARAARELGEDLELD